jgi:flagellar P-ring protein precursor FlgI
LKQLTTVVGVRGNQLIGYGLVAGLAGTGDTGKSYATTEGLLRLLDHLGAGLTQADIAAANCAAVLITAKLPPSIQPGETVDVGVASLGNARSLAGGTLMMTPLKGMDGMVYAVAQGTVTVGGYALAPGPLDSLQKNLPTVGHVAQGAIMEREVSAQFLSGTTLALGLGRTDFLACSRVVAALNEHFGPNTAVSQDGSRIDVRLPRTKGADAVGFLAEVGEITVDLPDPVKVVVNERTGSVLVGGDVPLAPLSVTHGSLHLAVTQKQAVSQGANLAQGAAANQTEEDLVAQEDGGQTVTLKKSGATVDELVEALNKLGVSPRDIISILQDVRALGAMQAELEVR